MSSTLILTTQKDGNFFVFLNQKPMKYDVKTSLAICKGRSFTLYLTPEMAFFTYNSFDDTIRPMGKKKAISFYKQSPDRMVSYRDAFGAKKPTKQ